MQEMMIGISTLPCSLDQSFIKIVLEREALQSECDLTEHRHSAWKGKEATGILGACSCLVSGPGRLSLLRTEKLKVVFTCGSRRDSNSTCYFKIGRALNMSLFV